MGRFIKAMGLALLVAAGLVRGAGADTIPTAQTFVSAWTGAGLETDEVPLPRRIVNVRDFGALGNGTANDYAAFTNAIASLNNQPGVVFIPPGNYYLRSALTMKSGVVLRGQSPTNTTITFSTNFVTDCINLNGSGFGAYQNIQSGATFLSTQVTVANPAVFTVGKYATVWMSAPPAAWTISYYGIGQIGRVTAITGNVITLDQPLRLDYSPYVPQLAPFNNPITNAGVENLKITRDFMGASDARDRDNYFTISLYYAANCWVRGCDLYKCFGAHVGMQWSTHNEVRGNYFEEAHEYDGGGSGYGVRYEYVTCENLTENNIFRKLRHSMLNQIGANGNVWGYNYSREGRDNWGLQTSDITTHGNYPFANLAEGNIVAFISLDNSHGWNGPFNTFFRNKATHSYGISDESTCRNEAYVGNETAGAFDPATSRGFCYGNTKSSGFVSATSQPWSNLYDYSYYLTTNPMAAPPKPSWWNIPQSHLWPVGPTNSNNYGTTKYIPAKSRYDAGGLMTYAPPSVERLPPEAILAYFGDTITLSAKAHGVPAVSYAWFKNGVAIPGATGTNLVLSGVSAADAASYAVSFTDNNGSLTSAPTALFLYNGTLTFTNDHGYLDVAGNWDPPAGPPDSSETGLIASAGAPVEAVLRSALSPAPAELIVSTGGVLALGASLTAEQGLTLDGGLLRPQTSAVTIARTVALRSDSTAGSDGPVLSLKWILTDHADGAGRLIVSNSGAGSVAVYSIGSPYSGGTEVRAGEMLVYSNDATGTGPVDVMPGGVFKSAAATLIQTNPVVARGGRVSPHLVSSALKAPIQVRQDSLLVSTNAFNLSVYGLVTDHAEGTGALIVSNTAAGYVSFNSSGSPYSGGTVVQRGELVVFTNDATGTGPVDVMPDGAFKPGAATLSQTNPVVLRGGRITPHITSVLKAPIQVRADSLLSSTNSYILSVYGPVTDHADGTGKLVVSNASSGDIRFFCDGSTYSGGTEVQQGTLVISTNACLGTGAAQILPLGTVQPLANTVQTAPLTMKGGRYYTSGNYSYNGPLELWSDSYLDSTGATAAVLSGPIRDFDGAHAGRLIKKGTGFLGLSGGTNLFSGGLEVREGTLACTVNGSLGAGPVDVLAGAILYLNGCSNASHGAGTITIRSNAVAQLNTSYSTNLLVKPGGIIRGVTGGNRNTYDRLRIEGDVQFLRQSVSGYVYWRGSISDGAVPGRFVLASTNPLPVYFTATNTYTGGTWLTDGGTNKIGELVLAAGGSLPDVGTVTLESNSVLNLGAISDTIGSLAGFGEVKLGATAATRLTVADGLDTVFAGVISGTGGLVRAGAGSLTLAGSNLWTGVAIVTGGLLRVNSELAAGPVTVHSNGFLGGAGTIRGALAVQAGGGFDWRGEPAMLTVVTNGTFLFGTNAVFRYRFNAESGSRLVVQGTLALPAQAAVEVLPLSGGLTLPRRIVLMQANALTGASSLANWRVTGAPFYAAFRDGAEVVLRSTARGSLIILR